MKRFLIVICLLCSLVLAACEGFTGISTVYAGSGNTVSESRAVDTVSGVTLAMQGELTIVVGAVEGLVIEAEDNLLPYIQTDLSHGMLTIRNDPAASLRPTQPIHFTLTVKALDTINISSSGNIETPALEGDRFTINISSSGELHITSLAAASLAVSISSSGSVTIDSGEVSSQSIHISSSGDYIAGDVKSQQATVSISSSGSATIWVTDTLTATVSSSGNVNYYGNPAIQQHLSSSGQVVALGYK